MNICSHCQAYMENYLTIGQRLKEERERLRFTQESFGALAGLTRKTQANYESDERRPDVDYLSAIASVGTDILYILNGVKSAVNVESSDYDAEAMEIAIECVELYISKLDLKVSPAKKSKVIGMLYPKIRDDQRPEGDNIIDLLKLAADVEKENADGEEEKEHLVKSS